MKLAIFGATGATGQCLVEQALDQGYDATAFARNPLALTTRHARLSIVRGDVFQKAPVQDAVANQDAVKTFGVSRLICLSAWGVGESKGRVPVIFRNVIFPLLMKEEYEDKEAQEQLIQQSTLDWTIVRSARLTNGPRTGNYRMNSSLKFSLQSSISRADVADCMLRQLTDQTFRQKCIELCYCDHREPAI